MKKIIIGIITIFLLTSCYSNPEDAKKITKLEKQIQNNIFNKKKECFELKDKILNDIKIRYNNQTNWKLEEIFYSKNKNSCLYVTKYNEGNIYDLINLFNNKIIITKTLYKNENGEFENKIKELKK